MTISIITPVLNGAATIATTISSVVAQSTGPHEYIIKDGGSSDGTVGIARECAISFVNLIESRDTGIYDAMNQGIVASSGDIIGIINADDFLLPDAIAKVQSLMAGYDILMGGMLILNTNGSFRKYTKGKPELIWFAGWHFNHPALFVKRAAYDKIGLYDSSFRISGDIEWILRARSRGLKILHVNYPLAALRRGGLSSQIRIKGEGLRARQQHCSSFELNIFRTHDRFHHFKGRVTSPIRRLLKIP